MVAVPQCRLAAWRLDRLACCTKYEPMHAAPRGTRKLMPQAQRREALGQPAGDTDPFYDSLADHSEPVRGTLIRSEMTVDQVSLVRRCQHTLRRAHKATLQAHQLPGWLEQSLATVRVRLHCQAASSG